MHPDIAITQSVVSDLEISGTEKNILNIKVAQNNDLTKIDFNSSLLL